MDVVFLNYCICTEQTFSDYKNDVSFIYIKIEHFYGH